jgi:hypothetical protein
MFKSPNTPSLELAQRHLGVQERPATIAPKASALRLISPKINKNYTLNHHISGEFGSFKKDD